MLLTPLRSLRNIFSDLPVMALVLASTLFVNRLGDMVKIFMTLYLRESLGLPIDTIGWLIASLGGGFLLGSYLIAILSDYMSTTKLAIYLLIMSGITLVLLIIFKNVWLLGLVLFISGIMDGGFRPITQRLIMEICPIEERRLAQSLNIIAINLAVAIAGVLGGLLSHWDYRLVFIFSAFLAFFAAGWFAWALQHWNPPHEVTAPVEIRQSKLLASPYADKAYLLFMVAVCFIAVAYYALISMFGNYLLDFYKLGASSLGWQFTLNGLLVVVLQIPLIHWSHTWGERWQISIGIILFAIGLLMLPFGHSFFYVCISTIIWTIGEILFMTTMSVFVIQRADGRQSGHYLGLYSVCWGVSTLIAPIFGSQLYVHLGGNSVWFGSAILIAVSLPIISLAMHEINKIKKTVMTLS